MVTVHLLLIVQFQEVKDNSHSLCQVTHDLQYEVGFQPTHQNMSTYDLPSPFNHTHMYKH